MSDPNNPDGGWQQVPTTPTTPPAYVPPPQAGYPPPPPNYPPPGYQQQPPPPPGYAQPPAAAGLSSNGAAAISYLTFIPAVIFLVIDPYKRDPFVRFHAMQCIALTVLAVAIGIVLGIIAIPLAIGGLFMIFHLVSELINLAFFVLWLICVIQASQGKWFKIPVIGDFAMKMAKS